MLASVGLYGVMAFVVARRRRELGLRLALGAQPAGIIWLVMKEVIVLLAIGLAVGVPAAIWLGRFVSSRALRHSAERSVAGGDDGRGAGAGVRAAGLIPARRASRIDPILALRQDMNSDMWGCGDVGFVSYRPRSMPICCSQVYGVSGGSDAAGVFASSSVTRTLAGPPVLFR